MQRTGSRRIFLAAASAIAGSLLVLKKMWPKSQRARTATFLTREGTLVEVPLEKVPAKKTAVTKERLVSWIWRNQKLIG